MVGSKYNLSTYYDGKQTDVLVKHNSYTDDNYLLDFPR